MPALSLRLEAPILRFSLTVRSLKILRPSGTGAIPSLMMSRGLNEFSRWPSNSMSPALGVRRPDMAFWIVDLPAPFAPSRATMDPGSTSSEMPRRARTAP